jgi:peptidoglycan/xylan/chitin deacetylase (PgdA/CDA1 family)
VAEPTGPDDDGTFRHSQRKLEVRRRRVRRRSQRRRMLLLAGTLILAVLVAVLLPPHHERTQPRAAGRPALSAADRAHLRHGWRHHRGPVPVLMYHRLEPDGTGAGASELFVPPRLFRRQMAALRRHGYTAVTLQDVHRAWAGTGLLPPRPIVLTFDDGYRSQYTVGFRRMRRMHWPGVLFLLPNATDIRVGPTARQVRRMLAAGWELGSHTINHRDLRHESGADLIEQTAGARRLLQQRFGREVTSFAYPGGDYDSDTIRAVRAAGYDDAVTVAPGVASRARPLELARIRVDAKDTPAVLLRTLADGGRPPGL